MKKQHVTASLVIDEAGQKAIRETDTGTRIVMVASTSSVDRDGESIRVDGWHWNESALPKLLWGHDYHSADAVIGRLTRVWKEGGNLMIEAELADKVAEAETARLVAGLIRSGFLDQGSVGFIPDEWIDPDGKKRTREDAGAYYGSTPGRTYTKQELLEFSIVPVPSQRDSMLVGVRALGLADASPGGPLPVPAPAVAEPEHEATPDPEPEPAGVAALAEKALPDPADDWLMALLKIPGEPFPGALLSRAKNGQGDEGNGWVPDFLRPNERVETPAE